MLQTCLTKITLVREKDLDRAQHYFELFELSEEVCVYVCTSCLSLVKRFVHAYMCVCVCGMCACELLDLNEEVCMHTCVWSVCMLAI